MPRTVKRKKATNTRQRFDAQVIFQLKIHEKRALASLVDGRRFRVMSDVLREAAYRMLEHHKVNPESFRDTPK